MLERLKEIRQSKGLSQADVARSLNISRQSYNFYESGKRDPDTKMLATLASFFNATSDYLLGITPSPKDLTNYVELPPENKKLPIIGTVKCGPDGLAFQYLEGYILIGEEYKGDVIAFRCRGDSMKDLGINSDDIAIVRQQEDVENGELAIVVVNGEEGMLKRVRKFEGGIILESANSEYPPRIITGKELETVHIVGKVLEVRKKF